MPEMLKSMIGVLPVAISTIIVSPTARPRPIMIAEKLRLKQLAGPRVRPFASDSLPGPGNRLEFRRYADRASSVIVKTMGMTAKPIIKPTTSELLLKARPSGIRPPQAEISDELASLGMDDDEHVALEHWSQAPRDIGNQD